MFVYSKLAPALVVVLALAMTPEVDAQLLRARTSQCTCQQMVRYAPAPQYYAYSQPSSYVQPTSYPQSYVMSQPGMVVQPTVIGQPIFNSIQPMIPQPIVGQPMFAQPMIAQPTLGSAQPVLATPPTPPTPQNGLPALPANAISLDGTATFTETALSPAMVDSAPTLATENGEGVVFESASDIPVEITGTSETLPASAQQPVAVPEPVPTGDSKIMPPKANEGAGKSILEGT